MSKKDMIEREFMEELANPKVSKCEESREFDVRLKRKKRYTKLI